MSEPKFGLLEFLRSLGETIDLTHSSYYKQHSKVALIANRIGDKLKISSYDRLILTQAALIRDIGTLTLSEREQLQPMYPGRTSQHCTVAFLILKRCPTLFDMANTIRFHHSHYEQTQKYANEGLFETPMICHILHLADRIATQLVPSERPLEAASKIYDEISEGNGTVFHPDVVAAFGEVSQHEYFWLDLNNNFVDAVLDHYLKSDAMLSYDHFEELAKTFQYFTDFRSEYTITHTTGVAAVADKLAECMDFSESDQQKMRIAAYLHDIGKYATPAEILEKPVQLSVEEFSVVRAHPYHTYQCLDFKTTDPTIRNWASWHHERLDKSGYPWRLSKSVLDTGNRIMAVADVFSAIIEDRPYRSGRNPDQALAILREEVANGKFDSDVVDCLQDNFKSILDHRESEIDFTYDVYNEYIKALVYF